MKQTKAVLQVNILNKYRSKTPYGFYNLIKGHTGEDYNFVNDNLISPVTGKIVAITNQAEMGRCIYLEDTRKNIHVFAHLSNIFVKVGGKVTRNDLIAVTGNTGKKTTKPHLHYEIIAKVPLNEEDKRMTRTLYAFKGYNTSPSTYLKMLYKEYNIGIDGQPLKK